MKNKTQIAIGIGLMCILLAGGIVVQLNTIEEARKIVGTSYAQQELKEEVLRWKEEYERKYRELEGKEKELETTRQVTTQENSRAADLQEELDEANRLLGLTELTGTGIVLTLRDNDTISSKDGIDMNKTIIHDEDLREMVNELKNSGAEAISINGQRIVSTTAITCSGAVITINDVKINSPFEIRAIGKISNLNGIARQRRLFVYIRRRGENRNVKHF